MTRSSTTTTQSSVANKTIDHDDDDRQSQPTKNNYNNHATTTTIVDNNPPKDNHEYSVKTSACSNSYTNNATPDASVEVKGDVNTTAEIFWEYGGQEVFVTGTFDQWNKSLRMKKQPDGRFVANLQSNDKTILYKFVVDGVWNHDGNQPIEKDKDGNINNVLQIQ
ncbi:immunoglobulin E-set [Absidia repens]|uniref:Immunoglobulin E-set n=1 Tax=Absidia repens TaxID=90262 RepID=A0A1X2IE29_9FUNG|nr:immunoglobulin E-set [Absidia repens]